jgi:hypothetical protein
MNNFTQNCKFLIRLKKVIYILIILGVLPIFCPKCFNVLAQNPTSTKTDSATTKKEGTLLSDSTLAKKDTLKTDTAQIQGDIKTTIFYTAKDSAVFLMDNQLLLLYKDAEIKYGAMKIKGAQVEGDMKKSEVTARYEVDTAGKKQGIPVFTDESQEYQADQMRFNFKTKKGIVHNLVTRQGEGLVHGENVFKDSLENLYNHKAKYTTCDLPNPHFHIGASRIKMIPNKKVLAGPFNLYINDIWTPLGFLFGMFPVPKEKASGLIVPSYGEARDRGFYLQGGGYYLALSDYFDLTLTGDVYSLGGWGFNGASSYLKKYRYSGNVGLSYYRRRITYGQEKATIGTDYRFNWSHSPVPKGLSRFSANVSFSTSRYNSRNSMDPAARAASNSNSAINYSTGIRGTQATISASLRALQDFSTNRTDLTLPQFSFSSGSIIPFQSKTGNNKGVLRQIRTSYSMNGQNQITNVVGDSIYDFKTENFGKFFKNSNNSINHSIPLSTNFKVLKSITVTPSLNYSEIWRFKHYEPVVVADTLNTIDTVNTFSRQYQYGASASASTTFYGMLRFKKGGLVEAVRHQVNPTIGLSYVPDLSKAKNGQYTSANINGKPVIFDKYSGAKIGNRVTTEAANVSFGVNNIIEMKVRSRNDSASDVKKVKLLDNFNFSSAYNVLADSFNLSNFSFNARTTLFEKVSINFGGAVDPYTYIENGTESGRKVNKFAWNEGQGFGEISNLSFALSTSLNPDFFKGKDQKKEEKEEKKANTPEEEEELRRMKNNPEQYVDWNVPWNLSVNFNMSYSKSGLAKSRYSNNLSFNGDVSLTEKWKMTFYSGYDFDLQKFADVTSFGIVRDLHCWELNVNWSPFGVRSYYNVEIHVKSSILKDLKLTRKRNVYN